MYFLYYFLSFKNLHVGCEKGNPLKNIQCGLGPGSQTCPQGYYCNSNELMQYVAKFVSVSKLRYNILSEWVDVV
jgi:hypothetical protein